MSYMKSTTRDCDCTLINSSGDTKDEIKTAVAELVNQCEHRWQPAYLPIIA